MLTYGETASGVTYRQSDPIGLAGGSWSTYTYVNGNPLRYTDPKGEEPQSDRFTKQCGKCTVTYDSDQFKGAHTHWKCPGQPQGCVKKDGTPCDGSVPPPPEVAQCLRNWGRIPKTSSSAQMCGPTCQGAVVVGGICLACVLQPELCIPAAVAGGAAAQ